MRYKEMSKLKGRLREKGLTYKEAAGKLGMGINTLSDKLNGSSSFTLDEADKLAKLLEIKDDELREHFFLG